MTLPLLEALEGAGGHATTAATYDAVARLAGVGTPERTRRVANGKGTVNAFERDVRWAQQRAKLDGLARRVGEGDWEITGKGRTALRNAKPGLVVTIFTTASGVALWASCEDAVAHIDDASCALILTSPPYPLLRKKAYGNEDERAYVSWLIGVARTWPRILTRDGSIVLNLGDAWNRGEPTLSLYQERLLVRMEDELGMRLCQRFSWHNPSKMPAPAQWVTVNRVRVKPSVESAFWLSQNPNPKSDNRRVLTPYGDAMRRLMRKGGEAGATRPSGHAIETGAFSTDNGGAIPGNLIVAANTQSNGAYARGCRAEGLPAHPARFPEALPEFFIRMLTDEGDAVYDPFGGSGATASVAERLGRRWLTSERSLEYVRGARHRF